MQATMLSGALARVISCLPQAGGWGIVQACMHIILECKSVISIAGKAVLMFCMLELHVQSTSPLITPIYTSNPFLPAVSPW